MKAQAHGSERQRLVALRDLDILDTPREARFDELAELAADICGTPIAVINLIDERRQWFKAEVGLGVRETPLESSICAHIILGEDFTLVEDTLADPRFCDNPLCIDEPNLRFYAGALLKTEEGLPVGTLCVLGHEPRTLSDLQIKSLKILARQVMAQILLGRALARARLLRMEVDHRTKNSLALIASLLSMQVRHSKLPEVREQLSMARNRVQAVAALNEHLHATGSIDKVDIARFLTTLAEPLRAQLQEGLTLTVEGDTALLAARDAVNVGIVVNELVTNAVKHAFVGRQTGTIVVGLAVEGDEVALSVADDGIGIGADFDPKGAGGLGMKVVLALATQLGTSLTWTSTPTGTRFGLRFSAT
jgi:two-component sensor histidine kinase